MTKTNIKGIPSKAKKPDVIKKSTAVKKVAVKKTSKAKLPVEIICIVDRSGSMSHLHDDVVGGINSFIDEQKKIKGKANITLVEFDNVINTIANRQNLKDIKPLDKTNFVPRGSTALNDAIGKTVTEFAELRAANKINKAIFCIMTDGAENASNEFRSKEAIKALTERVTKDYNWEFVYLAANQDAFKEGNSYGMTTTMNFTPTGEGLRGGYAKGFTANTSRYRTSK